MKNILVICGPTASGKTSLALKIAKEIIDTSSLRTTSVNILSADSRQIYRDLDLLTGKDIPRDLSPAVKIFGLSLVDANKRFNLSDFTRYAHDVIQSSLSQNTPLIIVGGTGLYLKAITSDLLTVHVPPNEVLRNRLEKLGVPALQKKLKKLNPQKFASLNNSDVHNPRRLIRSIEIASSLPVGEQHDAPDNPLPTFHWIGLRQDKDIQKAHIHQRVLERLESGAIKEVQILLKKFPDHNLPLFTSLGVPEIVEFIDLKITRENLIENWVFAENDYARRQMVWFRKQSSIIWYDKSKVTESLVKKLAKILKQND